MSRQLTRRLRAAPERLRRRTQAWLSTRACARHPNPLAGRDRAIVTTFFDVEGDYAMPGMQSACITTVEKILQIQSDVGIRSTYNVVGELALDAPGMIAGIRAAGHEVASHSLRHRVLTRLSGGEIHQDVSDVKRAFDSLATAIGGHRSPQSAWNRQVTAALCSHGFRWSAEDGPEPYPYPLANGPGGRLWRFPVRDDDWQYESNGLRPQAMLARWQQVVDRELGAGGPACGRGRFVAIGFHPWVERSPDRLSAFKDFMTWLREYPDIEIMPFGHVVALIDAAEVAPHTAPA
jgi:peptidoglycan/xylan/chitin deacetylase (PgdA/CDA1 family)